MTTRRLSFDPGVVNCGQILVHLAPGEEVKSIVDPYVHDFTDGGGSFKTDLSTILKNVNRVLCENETVKYCLEEHLSGKCPLSVRLESQEHVHGNIQLANALIRMGTVSGAIYTFFDSKGVPVEFSKKNEKYLPPKKSREKSKNLKDTYAKAALGILKHHAKRDKVTKKTLKWTKRNKKIAQHVYDSILQGVYNKKIKN